MKPLWIVEVHIVLDEKAQLWQTEVLLDFDVLVFQRPSKAFHLGIPQAAASSIHTDFDAIIPQLPVEFRTGELTALIQVEYLRLSETFDRHFEHISAMKSIHRIDLAIRHHLAPEPILNADHKRPVTIYHSISYICTPGLI